MAFSALLPSRGWSQAPSPESKFEIASVKMTKAGGEGRSGGLEPGGRFTVTGFTLRELIGFAYASEGRPRIGSQLSGGPVWVDKDQFDIDARAAGLGAENSNGAAGAASQADMRAIDLIRAMLRSLLIERFHVAVHEETRQMPSYTLTMVKDGVMGPQLHRTDTPCAPDSIEMCGGFQILAPGRVTGRKVPVKMVAGMLGQLAQEAGGDNRPVTDATGLTGNVDLDLNWTPDGASIFTAIQEQLGLKFVSARAPVSVLVIDHADHPTPN